MKKILIMCVALVPMLFASEHAVNDVMQQSNVFEESGIRARVIPDGAIEIEELLDLRQEDSLYYYTSDPTLNGVGLTSAGVWEGGIRLTPTELAPYAGWYVTALIWYHYDGSSPNGQVKVYDNNTPTLPGAVITTEPYSGSVTGWERVDLTTPVPITGTGDLWCLVELNDPGSGFFPLGVDAGPAIDGKGDWLYLAGWYELQNLGLDYNWGFIAIVEDIGGGLLTFDFEDGLQGWTHTNGLAFPAGWDVEVWNVNNHTTATSPSPGDSSMWIDSDAAGSAIIVNDTAYSPVLVPNPTMQWFKWGCGYQNYALVDTFSVGIREMVGGVWQPPVTLRMYVSDIGANVWDSVDVSSYASSDYIQLFFAYTNGDYTWYASFDNVSIDATIYVEEHDVGCTEVVSPPEGTVPTGDYDVIGRIQNLGGTAETFDVTANVYDTVGMVNIFSQTVTLTAFPVAGDSNVNFGTVTFGSDSYYYTEIYTELAGDVNPSNDTSAVYSTTAISPGDIVFELDAETITGDVRLVGLEFDGEYFYLTGASDYTQTWVYVVDTAGTLLGSDWQPAHSTGWGWRDIAWDYAYRGTDRIDTLYSSVNNNVDKWGYDFVGDSLIYYGSFLGAQNPNRALAYDGDDEWFFTATFANPCYKFSKTNPNIQSVPNTWAMYGAAYDAGHPTTDGPWVWWHSQDDPGTGQRLMIHQMEPQTMNFTGLTLAPNPTLWPTGIAGGLCYWSDFRGMDVLFGLSQDSTDYIFGVFVRMTPTGIEQEPGTEARATFGFAPMANPVREHASISYAITRPGMVSLKVYDRTGRLVETLVNSTQNAGAQTVTWDARNVANGVYFVKLEADNQTAVQKLILVQ